MSGRSFDSETTGPFHYREQVSCPAKPVFYLMNIDTQDAQDAQDYQDGRLRTTCSLSIVNQ